MARIMYIVCILVKCDSKKIISFSVSKNSFTEIDTLLFAKNNIKFPSQTINISRNISFVSSSLYSIMMIVVYPDFGDVINMF